MAADWKTPCWNVVAEPGGPFACALTWCCPCVTYGMNVSKLGDAQGELIFAGQFTPACCLYCIVGSVGCPCIVHIPTRNHLRKKYGVKEPEHGLLEEVFLTWCCSCCVLIQDYNEIAAQSGAPKGAIIADLNTAMDTATEDIKKQAQAAKEGLAKSAADEKQTDEKQTEEKHTKEEEVKLEAKDAKEERKE